VDRLVSLEHEGGGGQSSGTHDEVVGTFTARVTLLLVLLGVGRSGNRSGTRDGCFFSRLLGGESLPAGAGSDNFCTRRVQEHESVVEFPLNVHVEVRDRFAHIVGESFVHFS